MNTILSHELGCSHRFPHTPRSLSSACPFPVVLQPLLSMGASTGDDRVSLMARVSQSIRDQVPLVLPQAMQLVCQDESPHLPPYPAAPQARL